MSDFIGFVLQIILVVMIILFVGLIVFGVKNSMEVADFFEAHPTASGVVVEYKYEEAHTYTTTNRIGKVSVPQIHHVPDQYYITINCVDGELNYTATYKIAETDYQAVEVGSVVEVSSEWSAQGYEVIE